MNKLKQNIPNMITISRIISSVLASILFVSGLTYPAIILYIIGAVSDALDGFAARKLNAFTELGKKLDPISDKIFALSLLAPSLILGNYLMFIPLVLEAEISSITIAAKKSKINIETERVGKYKTWFLFSSIIAGLIATKYFPFYFVLAPLLCETTNLQIQSIKAYNNQYKSKLQNTYVSSSQLPKTNNKNIKEELNKHYEEFINYRNIEVNSQNNKNTKKLVKIIKKEIK